MRTQSGRLILDDSYNASPESTLAALNLLNELEGRHVAVLGEMLELGQYERQGHEMVGLRAAEVAERLIAVGERAAMIVQAPRRGGYVFSADHLGARCARSHRGLEIMNSKKEMLS